MDNEFQTWLETLSSATQEVTKRLVTANKAPADAVTLGWFVLELVGDDQPELVSFDSYAALADHVRRRGKEQNVRMFCYWGAPIRLTLGDHKFVVLPGGERTPLFHVPTEEEMEFDDEGQFTDTSDVAIDEVTELNVGGSSIPLGPGGTNDIAPEYPEGFDEYDEVEDGDEYAEEEPSANEDTDESYDEPDEEYDEEEDAD